MKNLFYNLFLLFVSLFIGYCSLTILSGKYELTGIFVSGVAFGIFLMTLKLNVKNTKIDIYKRELEKESVVSDESLAKVKVLEAKIKVLEKALENAINK